MAATARAALPYPVLTDSVDVPRDVKALADKLAIDLGLPACTSGTRPATGNFDGRAFYETDTGRIIRYSGAAWSAVSGSSHVSYVCTVAGIPGTATATVAKNGTDVAFRIHFVASGAATGPLSFSLPVASGSMPIGFTTFGTATAKDTSAGSYVLGQAAQMIDVAGAQSSVGLYFPAGSANAHVALQAAATAPITWASGDTISISGNYVAGA